MTTSSAEVRQLVSLIRARAVTWLGSDSADADDEIAGMLNPGELLASIRATS